MSILNTLFDEDKSNEEVETEIEATEVEEASETVEDIEETTDDVPVEGVEETEVEASPEVTETTTDAKVDPKFEEAVKAAEGRLGAAMAEREKRQAAEAQLRQVQQQMAEMQRQMQEQANQNIPDPNYDPAGYAAAMRQQQEQIVLQAEQAIIRERFVASDEIAREKYGQEEVEAAASWMQEQIERNPELRRELFASPKPMIDVVERYKREQKLSKILSNEEEYFRSMAERLGYVQREAAPATPVMPVAAVTPATTVAKPAPKAPKLATAAQISAPATTGGRDTGSMVGVLGLK